MSEDVAVKELKNEDDDPREFESFKQELEILRTTRHANIVDVYG